MKKGLVIVHTGHGKGKTTAAFGLALRAAGHGMKVIIVQFIKSAKTGELKAAERLAPELKIVQMGGGFVRGREAAHIEKNAALAGKAMRFAADAVASKKYDMVILDEANCAVFHGLIKEDDIVGLIKNKPAHLHLVITGRDAPEEIIRLADTVTEMKETKHAYHKGIKAQKGIEF